MLKRYQKKSVFVLTFSIICAVLFAGRVSAAPEGVTVGILPFFIHSQENIGYLQKAIPDMLATRLEKKGEINTIQKTTMQQVLQEITWDRYNEEQARLIGERLGADFIIAGSLTKLGKSYSLDTTVINLSETDVDAKRLYLTAEGVETIPAKLRDLALRLNFAILDKIMVASVGVSGNRFIEEDAVLFAIQTKVGEVFSPTVLQEDLRRIFQMGYFKDIQITSKDTDSGKEITFHVKEKPMVRSVQIKGNKNVKLEDIRKTMEVKPRTILDLNKVNGDIARIRKTYKEKGYYKVSVSHRITPISENYTSIDFIIKEGTVVKVKGVTFSGNNSIPAKEIKRVMETREKHWILSLFTTRGVYKDEGVEKDLERITAYYYSKGFLQVKVDKPKVTFKNDGIYVHFTLTEGNRFTIGAVDFKGDLIFDTGVLKNKIKSASGETFNGRILNDDLIAIKAMYAEKGFAFADVSPLTDIQSEQKKVNLIFDIVKGEMIYIEEIRIIGNTRTRDNVIRREIRLTEGAVYNSEEIKRSKQEINNLGFFEKVNINSEPGSKPNLVKLTIEVKERPTGSFSIGAGYSSVDSVVGMFQISQNNLFGKGQHLSLMAQLGGHSNYYNISFTEPWFRDTRTSVGFDLFNIEREYEEFDRDSSGINLRASWPLDKYYDFTRFYLTYRYETIDIEIEDWDEGVALDIQKQQGNNTVSSFIASIIKDSRDDRWKPRSGVRNSFSVELAGFGGDSKFITVIASMGKWFPLPLDTAFAVRGTIGQIFPYFGKGVPISEKFFLGGLDSMRGFDVRSVGPRERRPHRPRQFWLGGKKYTYHPPGYSSKKDVVGGKKQLYFNFEYLFPIMKEAGVRGVLFFDTGNAYASGEQFLSDMRHCVGVGVNWYSPFGPLRIVWGVNLSPKDDEDSSNFEFSMGRMF